MVTSTARGWQVFMNYRKVGRLRYLSHLDVMRALERALRRSALPVKYTEGFNRRMRMHFGPALPVGGEGEAEPVVVELTAPVAANEIVCRLNEQLPAELGVVCAEVTSPESPSWIDRLHRARYKAVVIADRFVAASELEAAISDALATTDLRVPETSGKLGRTNLRSRIYELALSADRDDTILWMTLGVNQRNYLSPDRCLAALGSLLTPPAALTWQQLVRTEFLFNDSTS